MFGNARKNELRGPKFDFSALDLEKHSCIIFGIIFGCPFDSLGRVCRKLGAVLKDALLVGTRRYVKSGTFLLERPACWDLATAV